MKLGLGTVQFGQDYGVANRRGQVSRREVDGILGLAAKAGLRVIDTAPAYGDSETVLGAALGAGHGFNIVTKTPPFAEDIVAGRAAVALTGAFERSLERLRQSGVFGLLAHRPENILADGGDRIAEAMEGLRERGLARKIGISAYHGEEIDAIYSRYDFNLVQIPINVLDQRMLSGGRLARLKQRGVEIHARSAFLQGLLLMKPSETPAYFAPYRAQLARFQAMAKEHDLSPLAAALGFVAAIPEVDVVVCGIDTVAQLRDLLEALSEGVTRPLPEFRNLASSDEALVNPSRWRLQ